MGIKCAPLVANIFLYSYEADVSILYIYLKFDINAQLSTRLYDKRDDFNVSAHWQ